MTHHASIGVRPEHLRYVVGYACTNVWGIMMLYVPWTGSLAFSLQALISMAPGLVMCLACLLLFRQRLLLSGRTPLVAGASLCTGLGTLLCTYPTLVELPGAFVAGMVLSGAFAIIFIMAWFDTYTRVGPRGIIVLSGCSVLATALGCWVLLLCDGALASVFTSLLPMLSFVLLPLAPNGTKASREAAHDPKGAGEMPEAAQAPGYLLSGGPGLRNVIQEAVPLRTLAGFAITFFVLSSMTTVALGHGLVPRLSAVSLLIPGALAAFFVASGFFARGKIDPSILYKVLLIAAAAFVFLTFYLGLGDGSLTLYAHDVIDVMAWVVLALSAKKTPVAPHLVFAVGWIAECVGKTLGQLTAPLLAGEPLVFMAIVVMLVLMGVGFAFGEGYHLLDVDEGADRFEGQGEGAAIRARLFQDEASEIQSAGVLDDVRSAGDAGSRDAAGEGSQESGSDAKAQEDVLDPYAAFCAEYDLSPRESEVFRLWVTGHGLKYIQNALFVSESTVKSHLRSIYRKCDTHNRDEVIALFEGETIRPA